jgi:Ni2+-binding GTPase involved in maturation of urease and hydrogenase
MNPELTLSAVVPERAAAANRDLLARARVLAVALVGPPGAGKTALIEATARQLRGKARVAVVAMNPAAERDADRVSRYCEQAEAVGSRKGTRSV